ncbi:hypothetical protein BIHU0010003c01_00048 [Bifidobacterium phage BitterVaud1]|nr:hypothetical protein BIHU0010003c01_00048 [Bifidobacterium phage BitterVaud1]
MSKNVMMLGIGVISGAAATAALGYFCIIRKYIPMRELESEIDKLREEKQSICRQIDEAGKSFEALKKSYSEREQELENDLDILESEKIAQGSPEEIAEVDTMTERLDYQHPEQYNRPHHVKKLQKINDNRNDDSEKESEEDDYISEDDGVDGYEIIDDGIPRIDGQLTKEEQARLDECDNDEDLQRTVLTSIKEERWRNSIDPDNDVYQISSKEHENLPEFFDTIDLDYYRKDDVLAEGMNIVDKDNLIEPSVLNHFGKQSQTDDPNLVICRNDKLEADYMITLDERSFQEVIFGVNADEAWTPEKSDDNEKAKE